MNFSEEYQRKKQLVDQALEAYSFPDGPQLLTEAMRYSLLSGGKRLRGVLALSACEAGGAVCGKAMPFACAIEMIHAYSLIHDDLPAMDNDMLRRGKPTSHVVYGEANAILAGDGLLTEAFRCCLKAPDQTAAFRTAVLLADAAGSAGMVGGQIMDVNRLGSDDGNSPMMIDRLKTGALIKAAVVGGLICSEAGPEMISAGLAYGEHLGIAFQVTDDLLDVTGDVNLLGKTTGKDAGEEKISWVPLLGLDGTRKKAENETRQACDALAPFGDAGKMLAEIALSMLDRVS